MRGFCFVTTGLVVNDKRDKVGKGLKHLKIMTSFMDDPLSHFSVSQNKWCDKEGSFCGERKKEIKKERKKEREKRPGTLVEKHWSRAQNPSLKSKNWLTQNFR